MLSEIMLTRSNGLPRVVAANLKDPFINIRASYELIDKALGLTKLVERIVIEDVEQEAIFASTVTALRHLDRGDDWAKVWLYFLSQLTDALGVGISRFRCHLCQRRVTEQARWVPHERWFVCGHCQVSPSILFVEASPKLIKLLMILRSESYEFLRKIRLDEPVTLKTEEIFLREITNWLNRPWSDYASLARG